MKKILCSIATKMQPGIIQNLIARLGSKTPKMFKLLQIYSAIITSVLGSITLVLDNHQIPDFKYESIVISLLKFLSAFMAAITVSMSTHTESSSLHEQSNNIAQ